MSGLMEQPFMKCQCFGFEGRRCARRHKVRLEEVDEATDNELEAWEKRKAHTVQIICILALVFFFFLIGND